MKSLTMKSDDGRISGSKRLSEGSMSRIHETTRSSLRNANKSRVPKVEVYEKKRKMDAGRGNSYLEQINLVIRELKSKIEIQKRLKAGYEQSLDNVKEFINSYSSMSESASEEVINCKTHIEQIEAAIRQRGSLLAEKVLGEICSLGKSEEMLNNGLLNLDDKQIFEYVNATHVEYKAYQKRLEDNVMMEEVFKRRMGEKLTDLEKLESQIVGINAAIAESQSALAIQEKYKQKLRTLRVSKKIERAAYSIFPRPVSHPVVVAQSDVSHDAVIVINVSRCPVCNLAFERQTLDIIVASCGHTFHPFCLVCDGNILKKCPKCLCRMSELWLESFGIVEKETSHSQPSKSAERFNALSQAKAEMHPTSSNRISDAESSNLRYKVERCIKAETLVQKIADLKYTVAEIKMLLNNCE